MILTQRPDATRVAGYRTWQSLGRQVRKGETGIAVLAPCTYRAKDSDEPTGDEGTKVLRGFRVVHVFDVSQTEGEPLPDVERPSRLEGGAPAELWNRLAVQVAAAGFTLERGDCAAANGFTNYLTRTVRVRKDVEPAQAAKTLAHELAHVHLHDGTEYGKGHCCIEADGVRVVQARGSIRASGAWPLIFHGGFQAVTLGPSDAGCWLARLNATVPTIPPSPIGVSHIKRRSAAGRASGLPPLDRNT